MTKKITSQLLEKVFNESCWGSDLPDLVKMARLINDYFYSDPPSPDIAKLEKKEHQYGGENLSNGFDPAFGTPSPEMVCPKSTLCKYYTGENRCYWGIFVDDVKCNGNINRSDLFMCLNYSSPEPPEKVRDLLLTDAEMPKLDCFLDNASEIVSKWADKILKAQILKLQQAGWKSPDEISKMFNPDYLNIKNMTPLIQAEARQQAFEEFAFKVNEWLDKYDWQMKELRKFISELPKE
jgi:hypothetical protein